MKFLKILGWVFVPYIMLGFQWNKIGKTGKAIGSVWAVISLIAVITNATSDDKTPAQQASEPQNVTTTAPATTPVATQPTTKTESKPATTPAPAPAEQTPKMGDKVKVGNLEVTAKGLKQAKEVGNKYLNQKAQGVYFLVNVEVKNMDKEGRIIDTAMFKLVDVDGIEYDADGTASIYANPQNDFFLKNVNPKLSAKGVVAFDMPADAKGLKLKVDSGVGFAAGESVLIELVAPAKK